MTLAQQLADAFDSGLKLGLDSLSPDQRELYLIQDFIIEYEMNGLSGYFYNRLPNVAVIEETVAAMRRRVPDLASLLDEAATLFRGYTDPNPPTTWSRVLRRYDPEDKLKSISARIDALDDYGLNMASMS